LLKEMEWWEQQRGSVQYGGEQGGGALEKRGGLGRIGGRALPEGVILAGGFLIDEKITGDKPSGDVARVVYLGVN